MGAHDSRPMAAPCVFFFQAEDAIRDVAVTGVQTCALPISRPRPGHTPAIREDLDPVAHARAYVRGGAVSISVLTDELHFGGSLDDLAQVASAVPVRSEERRVGEEGRSRGAAYH